MFQLLPTIHSNRINLDKRYCKPLMISCTYLAIWIISRITSNALWCIGWLIMASKSIRPQINMFCVLEKYNSAILVCIFVCRFSSLHSYIHFYLLFLYNLNTSVKIVPRTVKNRGTNYTIQRVPDTFYYIFDTFRNCWRLLITFVKFQLVSLKVHGYTSTRF